MKAPWNRPRDRQSRGFAVHDPRMAARFSSKESNPIKEPATQSTIDAVMYSLRGGAAVLSRDELQHRVAVIDETQLLKMIDLLQKRDGKIAPRWSDEEVEQLMQTWTACHG